MSKSAMHKLMQSPSWKALEDHFAEINQSHMRDMFAEDPKRFDKFSLKLNDILFDFSKNIINEKTMQHLRVLADECEVSQWLKKMFDGEAIN
ncbi:MAG: glucose-6-phosphate isomerase, partial [Gammaproteobacteria bacterium]|nr:glucose-6-phosphate isomerase [Gammaproteobacteria bacterium]